MQTNFSPEQLRNPDFKRSNEVLRSCVHCGFCTATCPTYKILGDELDSPRGRIYLMKDMLENERTPDLQTVKHIDRCLSCLSCMTTCPSGVHYMHLIDHARSYINKNYKRPAADRYLRWLLALILPFPTRFRFSLILAKLAKPISPLVPGKRLRAMLALAPKKILPPSLNDDPQVFLSQKPEIKKRVALMTGCAQKVLDTDINDATIRILRRMGCEVVIVKGQGCCGALTHHMGDTDKALQLARANIEAWNNEIEFNGLDAIIINTSGCGTTVKDYGHMFEDTDLAATALKVSALAKDISEFLVEFDLTPILSSNNLNVVYHSACSLQHGQQIKQSPIKLLERAGFNVSQPSDAHICCGSAGTYNLLQPDISNTLKKLKVKKIEEKSPNIIAAGNIGCMIQISSGTDIPVVHTVELLDWATGGPKPPKLSTLQDMV